MKILPIPKDIGEYISYDPLTGEFTWKVRVNGRFPAGSRAGWNSKDGYVRIGFRGKSYLASRVAWFLHHGVDPEELIDHENRVRNDNRMCNLRDVSDNVNRNNRGPNKGRSHKGLYKIGNGWIVKTRDTYFGYFGCFNKAVECWEKNVGA